MGDGDRERMPATARFDWSMGPDHLSRFCLPGQLYNRFVIRVPVDIFWVGSWNVCSLSSDERYGAHLKQN